MEVGTNYGKRKTFVVLRKIYELVKLAPEGELLRYKIPNFFDNKNHKSSLSPIKEDEILYALKKWGALEINDKERLENEMVYYLKVLPKFEEVYLDHKNLIAEDQTARYSKIIANKLNFYPVTGDAEYKTAIWQFKGKARAFLTILCQNRNTNFNVEDLKKYCNPLITTDKYKFRNTKDINDTLREIRFRLKANKGEFFSIFKQGNGWIWLEK